MPPDNDPPSSSSSSTSSDDPPPLDPESTNAAIYLDILTTTLLTLTKPPKSKAQRKADRHSKSNSSPTSTTTPLPPADLSDSLTFASSLLFAALPTPLRTLPPTAFLARKDSPSYTPPLPPSLEAALLAPTPLDALAELHACILALTPAPLPASTLLADTLTGYLTHLTTPPPAPDAAAPTHAPRPDACELCARPWIPLTAHHLVPRAVQAKARKRGWHGEAALARVAWICRACHNFVHAMASNEELAREWYEVERIREREDVQRWVGWVGRVRWKAR